MKDSGTFPIDCHIKTTKINSCQVVTSSDLQTRKDKNGYVMVKRGSEWKHLHRMVKGDPVGKIVYRIKECTRPDCINPDHLKVGSRKDAKQEAIQRDKRYLDKPITTLVSLDKLDGVEYKHNSLYCKGCQKLLASNLVDG